MIHSTYLPQVYRLKKSKKGKAGLSGASAESNLKAGIAGVEGDARASRNISVTIQKLIETQHINTTNLQNSASKIKKAVTQALMDAVRDVEIVAS